MLLLDEFPLLRTDVIDALRQPLESGEVTIARGDESVTFPARGMVVLAANPCPCGDYRADARDNRCTCREVQRRDYLSRVRGPISDRIDITRHLEPARPHDQRDTLVAPGAVGDGPRSGWPPPGSGRPPATTAAAGGSTARCPGRCCRTRWPLSAQGQRKVDDEMYGGRLSRRGATRVHRLAWTLADLRGADGPSVADVETALQLRQGHPLGSAALRRAAS